MPDLPRIRWTIPLSDATPDDSGVDHRLHPSDSTLYDALDRRLMDTFPASDAVASY
jgi:hypothetical protein